AAVVVARASVVAAVAGVSTAVGALGDLEGILHGVIAAGGGRCVGADIGRSVRRGAEDVDRSAALVIGLDGVLVGGDVDALRVDLEVDVLAGFAVFDRESDALIFVGEVRGLDRLRRHRQTRLGGGLGLILVDEVMVPLRVSDSVPSRSMVTSKGTSPASRLSGLPSHQTWRTWSPSASAVSVFPVRE